MSRHRNRLWLAGAVLVAGISAPGWVARAARTPPDDLSVARLEALRSAMALLREAVIGLPPGEHGARGEWADLRSSADTVLVDLADLTTAGGARTPAHRASAVRAAFHVLNGAARLAAGGRDAAPAINAALASAAARLDGIPFQGITDAVWAVDPYKIRRHSRRREVSIFGYFPSLGAQAHPTVSVAGTRMAVNRRIGGIAFEIPHDMPFPAALQLPIEVAVPAPRWPGRGRILLGSLRLTRSHPYQFSVDPFTTRQTPYATVAGRPVSQHIDANTPSRAVHLSAETLFRETVGGAPYDPSSAALIDVQVTHTAGHTPCESCPRPNGYVTGWDAGGVALSLTAPRCDYHIVRRLCPQDQFGVACSSVCQGGNTEYRVTFIPTFTAKVLGTFGPALSTQKLTLGPEAVATLPLAREVKSAVVHLAFDDGFARTETAVALDVGREINTPLFSAQLHHGALTLTTK